MSCIILLLSYLTSLAKGEVFSWGSNFKGQLGQGDYENRFSPCSVYSMAPFGIISSKSTAKNAQLSHKRNKSSNTNPYQSTNNFT